MLERLRDLILERNDRVYAAAVITEAGQEQISCTPMGKCSNNYSVTKIFINTLVGQFIERGVWSMESRLTELLKEQLVFPYDSRWDAVTVRDALGHRMGLTAGIFDIDRDDPASYGTKDYLRFIFSCPPTEPPGTNFFYTDAAHYLLSRAITAAAGQAADEWIRRNIEVPLEFYPSSWQRCPFGYTVGATGSFMQAADVVKLAWVYLNDGEFYGKRLLSSKWVRQAERERFDFYPMRVGDFIGKSGIYGQFMGYSRKKKCAVAWHACEPDSRRERALRQAILTWLWEEMP